MSEQSVTGDVSGECVILNDELELMDKAVARLATITDCIRKPLPPKPVEPETATQEEAIRVPLAGEIAGHVAALRRVRVLLVGITDEISL